jgi:tellurite resistance protein
VSLAATVAAADQKVTLAEEERLEQHIANTLDLSPGEDLRLRAQLRWLFETGVNLNATKKRVEVLPVTKREAIGRFLVDVASADGEISPPEIDTLMKIYRMLGLDPKGIFAAAHAAATEPVTVRPPDQSPGTYAIPKPKPTAPPRVGPRIDMQKVASMHAESERVSALLREIFVEDETPRLPQIATGVLLLGLDGAQSAFLTRTLAQPSWSRTDLESVAAECEVLIEGTLDAINDASLSRYDDFLLEGDDPIELNEAVAKELKREYCEAARA